MNEHESQAAPPGAAGDRPIDTRKVATLTGWLMVITFVTSILAYFLFYAPVLGDPGLITGAGVDPTASVAAGTVLELVLIVANIGTAVVPYALFRRYSEGLALGYVTALSSSARSSASACSAS